jgi:DNA-binding beta-propeller fold protein YncE
MRPISFFWTLVAMTAIGQTPTPTPDVAPKSLIFVANEAFNKRLKQPNGVWCDSVQKEIMVADTGNGRVVIFDESGKPKAAFDHLVKRDKKPNLVPGEPRRIAVNSRGDIYIVDSACDFVDVCDFRGRSLWQISLQGLPGPPPADTPVPKDSMVREDTKPCAVAVDYKDNIYVASASRIYLFNPQRQFVRSFGEKGSGPGKFLAITGLWVDTSGRIYVTDAQSLGVHILDAEGKPLAAFGEHDAGFTNFSLPISIVTDRRGYIWVADSLRHVVVAFRRDGKNVTYLDYLGGPMGNRPGAFAYPSGLGFSWSGRLVVADRVGGRVQCFGY